MIPLAAVKMVNVNTSRKELLKTCEKYPFTRYPVYNGVHSNITGFINIYQCLTQQDDFTDVHRFIYPLRKLPSDVNVVDAINFMQQNNDKMILVTHPGHSRRPVGIVTMKDLVEELLGELSEW
jgi:CBS domain containing-hemolysin-like protein